MKKIFFLLLILNSFTLFAQQKKTKEKAPTKQDMNDMLKQAQNMMDEYMKDLDPEDKKMMDSLGIKAPDMKKAGKNLDGISNKGLATAWENENLIVPNKDAARIAAIPKNLTDARTPTYLAAIQKNVMNIVSAELRQVADKVFAFIKSNSANSSQAGNIAVSFWVAGKPQMAMYMLGKICVEDPANADNISNYASMLSMMGGQHIAIPLLNNLNTKFPKNSTVMNNLGQAWFGLGDIDKAGKYLDSALKLYPSHSQANLTKALIQESKGDKAGAIQSVKKSIKESYSKDKEDKLSQLGYKLNLKDIRVPFKPGADPLGLSHTQRPEYPMSIAQINALFPYWEQFNADCEAEIQKLKKEHQEATDRYVASVGKMATYAVSGVNGGAIPTLTMPPLFSKQMSMQMKDRQDFYARKFEDLTPVYKQMMDDLEAILKNPQIAPPEAPCSVHRDNINKMLKALNEKKKAFDETALKLFKNFYNEMAFYARYTSTDENMYNMVLIPYKINWLEKNREYQPVEMTSYRNAFPDCKEEDKGKRGKLADFDDVGCKIRDTTNLIVWQFYTTCTKLISKLNLKVIEYTRVDNFERAEGDYYIESSLKIAVEKGVKSIDKGPLKAEAKVGAAIEFEFDRGGVKDVVVSVEAKAGVGHNVLDGDAPMDGGLGGKDVVETTLEVGVEGKVSLVSGKGSVAGTGKLEGVKLMEW